MTSTDVIKNSNNSVIGGKDHDDTYEFCIPPHENIYAGLKVYDADINNAESVGDDKSAICKNMQIHVVDNKHNIHGLIEKEKVTNMCAEHVVTPKVIRESTKLNLHKKGINVSHLNVQSLLSSIDELRLWLKDNPYHVFTLTETWLDNTVHSSAIEIPGYVFERIDRNRDGGGVGMYIKDDIQYKRRFDLEYANIDAIWLETKQVHRKPIIISSLYCRSQQDVPEYLNSLSEIMSDVTNENKEIFLMGNLNCDFLKENPATNHMAVFMDMFNLNQLVTKVTKQQQSKYQLVKHCLMSS